MSLTKVSEQRGRSCSGEGAAPTARRGGRWSGGRRVRRPRCKGAPGTCKGPARGPGARWAAVVGQGGDRPPFRGGPGAHPGGMRGAKTPVTQPAGAAGSWCPAPRASHATAYRALLFATPRRTLWPPPRERSSMLDRRGAETHDARPRQARPTLESYRARPRDAGSRGMDEREGATRVGRALFFHGCLPGARACVLGAPGGAGSGLAAEPQGKQVISTLV